MTAASLRQILDVLPNGRCDFLKIDCEGCEFELLMNCSAELFGRIDRISLEYHDDAEELHSNDLVRHLRQHGYRVIQKANPVHAHLGFVYAERNEFR